MKGVASATKDAPNAFVASCVARSPTDFITVEEIPASVAVPFIAFCTPCMISVTVARISSTAFPPSMAWRFWSSSALAFCPIVLEMRLMILVARLGS